MVSWETIDYSINMGININFTCGSQNCRLMGIGWESNSHEKKEHLLAHISFMGLMNSQLDLNWLKTAGYIDNIMSSQIAKCMPQWSSEWLDVPV